MTDDKIALRALLEKSTDAGMLREMIGFAAERLMALDSRDAVWRRVAEAHPRTGLIRGARLTVRCILSGTGRPAGRAGVRRPSAAVRRSVEVRTFEGWDDPPPGFMEADLVAHSGPVAQGSFVQTLTVTDIATGWTECARAGARAVVATAVLGEIRKLLPFLLLGFDTDSDTVFLNETVRDYCEAAGASANTQAHGTPASKADAISAPAICGLVANSTVSGTCTRRRRA